MKHRGLVKPMSELTEIPKCKATREELRRDFHSLLDVVCPVCIKHGVHCLVGDHPSSAGVFSIPLIALQSTNRILFNFDFLLPTHSSSRPAPISAPQSYLPFGYHSGMPFGTLLSVPADAAGMSWVGFLSVIPAFYFFRKFGPCGGDVIYVILIVCLTFFCLSPFFLGDASHAHRIAILDAIHNCLSVPIGAAGKSYVDSFPCFLHVISDGLGPRGGDHAVPCFCLFSLLPFLAPFPFHGIYLHSFNLPLRH